MVSVVAIAMGAMIGSGIFILPGLAMAEAGPAVIMAFVLAGVLVMPAAISIAELGTAMPEAGGDYVFIERGMGPGAGTIAGLGTWLMLMFKGALALVGGMFYLAVLFELPNVEVVAVAIGVLLIAVNIIGVKQTGGLQTVMVVVMVLILGGLVAFSINNVDGTSYRPFYSGGVDGLLTATAMVLVSYAGVTKVAAVAEEIDNPGRNLPLGLLLSLGATTLLYALIVFVIVGLVDAEALAGSNIPMVDAVEPFFGFFGVVLIVVAAMLALISTANAGILTASRYPFALSRDRLLPDFFGRVNERFHTPLVAILVTGGAMLVIILFLPVEEIAKMAGSFQIIVYVLINVALIAFRVRRPTWYRPDYHAPAYPWVQIFGIVTGVGILTQMDSLPLIGGVVMLLLGALWYVLYGRPRVDREGIIGEALVETIEKEAAPTGRFRVVVPVANRRNLRGLMEVAAASAAAHENPELIVVNVVTVPDQTALAQEVEVEEERMRRQEELLDEARRLAEELGVEISTHAIVGRDISKAILDVIEEDRADEVVLGWKGRRKRRDFVLGSNIDPVVREASCEVTLVKLRAHFFGHIAGFVGEGPHTQVMVKRAAEFLRSEEGATLTLVHVQSTDAAGNHEEPYERGRALIHNKAAGAGLEPEEYEAEVIIADDVEMALLRKADSYDTVCIGSARSTAVERVLFGTIPEAVGEKAAGTVVIVRGKTPPRRTIWEAIKSRW